MYAVHLPEEVAQISVSRVWNLGSINLTVGAAALIEDGTVELGLLLMRHWAGDYGLVAFDKIDNDRNVEFRNKGGPFASLFDAGDDCVKVVTRPERAMTVVCLSRED